MELLVTKLFPDDQVEDVNEENKGIRQEAIHTRYEDNNQEIPLITNEEVAAAIKNLKSHKSPGPDQIRNEIYKAIPGYWSPYMSRLFNECLKQGKFPKEWKTANLIVLLKEEDKPKTSP